MCGVYANLYTISLNSFTDLGQIKLYYNGHDYKKKKGNNSG